MSTPNLSPIRLRVAGIFYDHTFQVSQLSRRGDGTITIEQVMDAARAKGNLDYGFEYRAAALDLPPELFKKSMIKIAHRIREPFRSLGGKHRPAGYYDLTEIKFPGGVVAWQYYVLRGGVSASSSPTGELVSAPVQANGGFTPYNEMPVIGGDTIIWRMVAIRTLD